MTTTALEPQIMLLQQRIDLAESNYKYAIQLHKDYHTLRRMRENIRNFKEKLNALRNGENKGTLVTSNVIADNNYSS